MPISQTDQLFFLVKSLTKAEKRNFTVYSKRIQDTENLGYIQLFEILDKQKDPDDDQILAKLKGIDKSQYSNFKRHLYKQLMISLRLIHIQKKAEIEIREYLDFVDILYSKGLYLQSLKLLQKAKTLADKANNDILYLSLLETEKTIESRHITRSGTDNTALITSQALEKSETILVNIKLSNLRLMVHAFYIKHGHVRNGAESQNIIEFFDKSLPKMDTDKLNFPERVHLYQSLVWYYYILLDFENCSTYAEKWIKTFVDNPEMIAQDPDLYMRGYHYLLTSLFNLREKRTYLKKLGELEKYRKDNYKKFSPNTQIISFLYVHHARLNKYFLEGTYSEGLVEIPKTIKRLQRYKVKMDAHRIMVFYFKFAWMYLMAGQAGKAVDYLNEIQKMEIGALREDIQMYTRVMFIMAHYDLRNYDIIDYLCNSAKSFAQKIEDKNRLQLDTIAFFQKIVRLPEGERKVEFKKFDDYMNALKYDKFERRAFIYVDVTEWLSTKLK